MKANIKTPKEIEKMRVAGRLATGLEILNATALAMYPPVPAYGSPHESRTPHEIEVSVDGGQH